MTDKAWKRAERMVAAQLGGQRVPVTGRSRGSSPDVSHPLLSIEVKHRKSLPRWLLDAAEQARLAARGTQVPIVVLHPLGGRHDQDLVLMEMRAFMDWLKRREG